MPTSTSASTSDYWSQRAAGSIYVAPAAANAPLELLLKHEDSIRMHVREKIKMSKAAVEAQFSHPLILRSLRILSSSTDMALFVSFLQTHYRLSDAPYAFVYTENLVRGFFAGCKEVTCLAVFINDDKTNGLVGTICGATREICYKGVSWKTVITNFLCIHKEHRDTGLAPYLIDELCLHSSVEYNATSGLFTCGYKVHPHYFDDIQWYHRLLDIDAVCRTGYMTDISPKAFKELYETFKSDVTYATAIIQRAQLCDAAYIHASLTAYLHENYECFNAWTLQDIEHFLQNPAFHCYTRQSRQQSQLDLFIFYEMDYGMQNGDILKHLYLYTWAFSKQEPEYIEHAFEHMASYMHHHKLASVITFSLAFPVTSPDHIKALQGNGLYYYFYNVSSQKLMPAKNAIVMM